jgi:hypothetical protein
MTGERDLVILVEDLVILVEDLVILVEKVVEAVSVGHAFKKLPVNGHVMTSKTKGTDGTTSGSINDPEITATEHVHGEGISSVLLDVPTKAKLARKNPGRCRTANHHEPTRQLTQIHF